MLKTTTAFFLVAFAAGCSPVSVTHDYDPGQDFKRLKTWTWMTPDPAEGRSYTEISNLARDRIRRAVQNELGLKGYPKVDRDPDFLVQTYATVGRKLDVEGGYHLGWYGNQVQVYDEGTLVIDVIRTKGKSLIWRGTAKSAVDPHADLTPEERDARIQEAVQKVLADFPPKEQR